MMESSILNITSKRVIIVTYVLYLTLISFKSLFGTFIHFFEVLLMILNSYYSFSLVLFKASFNLYSIKDFSFYNSLFSCYEGKEAV